MQKSLKISSFKEKFAAFSMKATDSKDLVKVNQILPIMQEYFGKSMNLACIKLMAYMLHALCVVQTVSLHKLASAMPTSVERDSNLRRIQRFIANYALNLDLVARMIFSLLPVKDGLVLSMDRTNWKFGEFYINILTLGITYKGIAFPLLFSLLDKRGNSNWEERKDIMERFFRLFGHDCTDCLVADREFIGKEWIGLTTTEFDTISVSGRTFGLSSLPQEKELEHGRSSIPSKSDRRNSTTSSFCTKGSMSISPEVESRTLTGYPNFRFCSVSTDLKMELRPIKNAGRLKRHSVP